eukprot:jgi/Picsp_1/2057/NSC_05522-R1_atp-dependent chaperone
MLKKAVDRSSFKKALAFGQSRWFTAETLLESPSEIPSTSSRNVQHQSQKSPSQGSDVKKEIRDHYRQPLGSHLKLYGRDLTADAEHGLLDPLIGRQDVVERTLQILLRRTKNNPVLIGDPGVGKTAVVEGIAQLMVTPESPRALQGCSLVVLDIGTLVGGTQYRGAFEERIQGILNDVRNSSGRIILFVDEIHMLMDTGRTEGGLNAANLLKPALARGELHCIGATTIDEYRKYIEPDAAFARRLQPVIVDEPSPQDTLLWLQGLRSKYEAHHGVEFSDEAIATAVTAAGRFVSDRKLPDSAIDLLDEAASRKQLASGAMGNPGMGLESRDEHVLSKSTVNRKHRDNEIPCPHCGTPIEPLNKDVLTISCINCGHTVLNIPPEKLMLGSSLFLSKKPDTSQYESELSNEKDDQRKTKVAPPQIPIVRKEDILVVAATASGLRVEKVVTVLSGGRALSQLGHDLSESLLGQSKSLTEMMNTLRVGTALASSGKRKKPLATFLLRGPHGTGKKTSCKTIAESLFGTDKSFLNLDMSQYVDRTASSRLIGAAPGFIGYGDGGLLTEFVKRHPHSVVVMDNIEKSHPEIISLLRQICQDGFIIDGMGRKIDFRNTVLGLITTHKSQPRKVENADKVSTSKHRTKKEEDNVASGDTMDVSTPNHAALELTIDKSGQAGSSSMSFSTVLRDTLQDCLDATINFENLSIEIIQSIAMREVESCQEIFEASGVSLVIDGSVYNGIFGNQQQGSQLNGHQARSIARAKILDPAFSELNAYLASAEPQTAIAGRKRIVVKPHGVTCSAVLE